MTVQEYFIKRCFQLAKKGISKVSPNPLVGSIITVPDENSIFGERIIGEGYHRAYGEAHAEVNAINSVKDKSLLKNATVYVNLEPCSHYGKTPPCAELLIKSKIKNLIVSNLDPNPLVSGKGIELLKNAGINVLTSVNEEEGYNLNKHFFHFHKYKKPYILLKWAQTKDGFLAKSNGDSKWISNVLSRQIVHKLRSEYMAILVGKNTAFVDNPALTTREWSGNSPIRLVVTNLIPDLTYQLSTQPPLTYYFGCQVNDSRIISIESLNDINNWCFNNNIHSIMIEGGSSILNQYINLNLWNEAQVFTGEQFFKTGCVAPSIPQKQFINAQKIATDTLNIYIN